MAEERGIAFEHGPYVQVAAFCETVVEAKDGTLTLVRLIDQLTHTSAGPEPPEEMPQVTYPMKLVVALKSGRARGRSELRIVPERPNGTTAAPLNFSVHFEGEHRGVNVVGNVNFTFTMEGLYWFRVYLDDRLLTAIPFRVNYQRMVTGVTRPPESG